jgi:hypothetical protein
VTIAETAGTALINVSPNLGGKDLREALLGDSCMWHLCDILRTVRNRSGNGWNAAFSAGDRDAGGRDACWRVDRTCATSNGPGVAPPSTRLRCEDTACDRFVAALTANLVVALPSRNCLLVHPSVSTKGSRHQTVGSNNQSVVMLQPAQDLDLPANPQRFKFAGAIPFQRDLQYREQTNWRHQTRCDPQEEFRPVRLQDSSASVRSLLQCHVQQR